MIALSIKLSESLAEASRQLAGKLGISRSELIRRALEHEITNVEAARERSAMAEGFRAMGENVVAVGDAEALDNGFSEVLPEDRDGWWNG